MRGKVVAAPPGYSGANALAVAPGFDSDTREFATPGTETLAGETLTGETRDGVPFPTYLAQHKMIPGIKVDLGAKPLAGFPGETITEGLDGLRERFAEYYKLGARFAKWRGAMATAPRVAIRNAVLP